MRENLSGLTEQGHSLVKAKLEKETDYARQMKAKTRLKDIFEKAEVPQQVTARDINRAVNGLEASKHEAAWRLRNLQLFEGVWAHERNELDENKEGVLRMARAVLAERTQGSERAEAAMERLERVCPGSKIPGVSRLLKEFVELEKSLIAAKGTEGHAILKWLRAHAMPERLVSVNCVA